MSNCTLAMEDDYSFQTATIVLELHFFAMFFPGYFTGKLIKRRLDRQALTMFIYQ